MARQGILVVLLLIVLCLSACVTQTERVAYYPHARYEKESVWDELRREFGWQKTPARMPTEPFYRRAVQGVAGTISGWFHKEEGSSANGQQLAKPPSQSQDVRKLQEAHRQFEIRREEALRRLYEQQEQQN
jgi:hypothetical protein